VTSTSASIVQLAHPIGWRARGAALLAAMLSMSCGSSSAPSGSDDRDPAEPGTVGAHVWDASSESLELRREWSYGGPASVPPMSGSSCWFFERGALSVAQREALDALMLVALTDACTYDGFEYYELTVLDRDGSEFVYRDTGCDFLRLEDAQAMLPANAFSSDVFPGTTAAACTE
jgi:hypothetical protein